MTEEGDAHPDPDQLQRLGQEAHDDVERRFVADVGALAEVEMDDVGEERQNC